MREPDYEQWMRDSAEREARNRRQWIIYKAMTELVAPDVLRPVPRRTVITARLMALFMWLVALAGLIGYILSPRFRVLMPPWFSLPIAMSLSSSLYHNTKALRDMFPIAQAILKGALARDECRGAHYKPDFEPSGITAEDPAERRRQAEKWCDDFEAKNRKWLKTTIATFQPSTDSVAGDPELSYEDVDTSLIPPRPRLYGLVGAEMIEEVWKSRQKK